MAGQACSVACCPAITRHWQQPCLAERVTTSPVHQPSPSLAADPKQTPLTDVIVAGPGQVVDHRQAEHPAGVRKGKLRHRGAQKRSGCCRGLQGWRPQQRLAPGCSIQHADRPAGCAPNRMAAFWKVHALLAQYGRLQAASCHLLLGAVEPQGRPDLQAGKACDIPSDRLRAAWHRQLLLAQGRPAHGNGRRLADTSRLGAPEAPPPALSR